MLEYATMQDSLFNTPPCFAVYMCGLVFAHMRARGGVPAYFETNQRKSQLLYDTVDNSNGFYASPVPVQDRHGLDIIPAVW